MSVARGILTMLYVAAAIVAATYNLTPWVILMSAMIIANAIDALAKES